MARGPQSADLKIRVSADLKRRVQQAAAELGESESLIVRQALNAYFARRSLTYPQPETREASVAEDPKPGSKSAAA